MRSSLDSRRFEEPDDDTEITLGGASILAIFFGVLLVCGLVFGFGYSVGRHRAGPPSTRGNAKSSLSIDTTSAHNITTEHEGSVVSTAALERGTDELASSRETPAESTLPDRAISAAHAALPATNAPPKPHAGTAAPSMPAVELPGTGQHPSQMVQIAAVSHQEDAEVLATALRKRGFSPMIRHSLGDGFYHVQVGPFADRAQAESIKDRLLSDGYNAIVK